MAAHLDPAGEQIAPRPHGAEQFMDEFYLGGLEQGLPGRLNLKKALIVVAAEKDGLGIGRIRIRQIQDASAESLVPFVRECVEQVASSTPMVAWDTYLWGTKVISTMSHSQKAKRKLPRR